MRLVHPKMRILLISLAILPAFCADKPSKGDKAASDSSGQSVLWRAPNDMASRNLFYGPGGQKHEPHGPFTFVKEDMNGTNPKFVVHDDAGVKWTVKLGIEARPETVASRLVWATGYFTDEDYFLPEIKIDGMPTHVKRGRKMIGPGGAIQNVRLKRHVEGREKLGDWKWRDDPFTGTQELNGLRTLMATINNWDLKDVNNEIYKDKHESERIYAVSDLGASFGMTREAFPISRTKGNLHNYEHSKFIRRSNPDTVSFSTPGMPSLIYAFQLAPYIRRVRLEWIGKDIPTAHAHWMGEILSRLSPEQIRDAFRAAGYSPQEADAFASVLERRIAELNRLEPSTRMSKLQSETGSSHEPR